MLDTRRRSRLATGLLLISLAASCSTHAVHPARQVPSAQPTPTATATAASSTQPSPAPTTVSGPIVFHGSRKLPLVALTFDSNLTVYMEHELDRGLVRSFDNRALVDELISEHVPATFFLAGLWMQRYPAEVRRLAAVPWFELGSHSYAHIGFAPHCFHLGQLPPAAMTPDIAHSEQVLHQLDPAATRLFRFPGGCYDQAALQAAARAHVQVIEYDVASGDAFGTSVGAIVRHTLRTVQNGSIVVLHVTGGNTAPLTAQVLPRIVIGLRARGLRLVTVSELLRAQAQTGPSTEPSPAPAARS